MSGPGGIPDADWRVCQLYGQLYGIDPLIFVAIGLHETGWGQLGDGRRGNILGYGSFDSGSTYQWAGVNAQVQGAGKTLQKHGVRTIADIAGGKADWYATDPQWKNGVVAQYNKISNGSAQTIPAGTAGLPGPLSSLNGIAKFLSNVLSLAFWQRFGLGLLGATVIAAGIYFMLPKQSGSYSISGGLTSGSSNPASGAK